MSEANRLTEAARKAMAIRAIPPTPQNYTIWYNYVADTMPPLRAVLDKLTAGHVAFTDEINSDLYHRYFGPSDERVDEMETGGHLYAVIEQLNRYLDDHGNDVGNFATHLDRISSEIGRSSQAEQVRALVGELVHETKSMAQRNALLEKRLNRIGGEVHELRENLKTVSRDALTDSLTGIPNRKFFDECLSEAAREATAKNQPLSLVIADIDHFKRLNDTFGHQTGDQVLRDVAQTLARAVKGQDTAARFGGEEFGIILPRTNLDRAAIVAEHMRQAILRQHLGGSPSRDGDQHVTLSFGVAEYRLRENLDELIGRADAALYRAKRTGRNRACTENVAVPGAAGASGLAG
ncbi:MAG TPA: GGDEF domain-containing protein [Stellaceae bacterium]|nr:GGDEF domain-containing protein [Stellaceae bacterium]